ncbi:diguanylate cyclase domain-containing protein [Paracoccus jiaweipingae]|uniref:diguanylate cyclase domain-containing protein n=1 Tax=unclassified Paracoccus (in: a-proteobacteria) TaxID=2688777 RepID=UPI00378FBCCC
MSPERIVLDDAALAVLMPMHLRLNASGRITGTGRTAARFFPGHSRFGTDWFLRTSSGQIRDMPALAAAIGSGARLFLRLRGLDLDEMRGHGVRLASGALLLNFGFAVGLRDAVRTAALTDADFAPSELAMELLFLQEANSAVMDELAHHNHQLEQARIAAERDAQSDPLTGLANRRALDEALARAVHHSAGGGPGFALVHLDLDLFKQVNDTFGHAAGDSVLRHVAGILRHALRSVDTVARIGGDEFTLILSGLCNRADLTRLSRRLIADIEKPIHLTEGVCQISASLGIAISTDYAMPDPQRMSADADAALYDAKRAGRGRAGFLEVPDG